jgi:hypothetical protein
MTLALRRTVFADGERRPDDYEVRHGGQTVGRIYRMRSTGRELWLWTQIGIRAPSHGPKAVRWIHWTKPRPRSGGRGNGYGAFESACGRSPRSNEELHEWQRRGR